jgi:hypothetical protein
MIVGAVALTDEELAAEVARRLGVATGRGAAAPHGQQEEAAPAALRRVRLVDELRAELAEIAAVAALAGEPAPAAAAAAPPDAADALLAIARAAGRAAAEKRAGLRDVVPAIERPRGYGTKQWFVVDTPAAAFRAAAAVPSRGVVRGSFAEVEGYVSVPGARGRLDPGAIFCGFVSEAEAAAYWEAANPGVALLRIPRRRFV